LHMAGWVEHAALPAALASLDVLLNTSDNEGLPVSLIEAMAAGVPIVATRAGGTVSLIEDGVTGRVVRTGNSDAIARATLETLTDRAMRERYASAARGAVHPRYDISTLVGTMEGFYTSLVAGNR
ncbi:MAG TPA: glycosyltransferase family 4 protein, partial [Chloroflexota bacterium]|nr:glycosyltransferase family 4 protein [Chloroflexota bacterium]